MIFVNSLPKIKKFLRPARLTPSSQALLIRLIAAFLHHAGRMSASYAAGAIRTEARHRAAIVRFLDRLHWSRDWTTLTAVAELLLQAETHRLGRWFFLLDQTYVGQQGQHTENTFSRANYRPRAKKSHRKQKKHARRSCHGFVCGLLLTPGGLRIPCCRSYYTEAYSTAHGVEYRTQIVLAAELIHTLAVPDGAEVVVLGDTAFESKDIRQACPARGFGWVVPINPERVLAGAKPRPKVASLAADLTAEHFEAVRLVPGQGADAAQRRAARCRLGPTAKVRTFGVHAEKRAVHNVGDVQLVFSTKEKPPRGQAVSVQKVLMTDRVGWDAATVVQAYTLRWQIELFFKECKGTLGLDCYRFRKFVKVENWVQACLVAFVYLEWHRALHLGRNELSEPEQKWWRWQRSYGIGRTLVQQAEEADLGRLYRWSATASGRRKLRRALREALPLEYRRAG
jgi:Transposase DDE domain